MSGRLIAHCGAEYIDREGLKLLETPQATDTWTPIPHYDLVTALEGQLKARGISIVKEQFAVQKAYAVVHRLVGDVRAAEVSLILLRV